MTPRKNIVRESTQTLPDGSPIPKLGKFKSKENAFIYWYTNPKTEAFMNSGRAAVRAGYKASSAVWYGYQLKQRPEISKKIDEILGHTKEGLRIFIYKAAFLSRDRMFWNIKDFYRSCKRIVKIHGVEQEINSIEAIPLNKISEKNRMCIDAIKIKNICGKDEPWYKLADRGKAEETFFKCFEIITGKKIDQSEEDTTYKIIHEDVEITPIKEEIHWKKAAEFLRGDDSKPNINHGKAPEKP